MFVDPWAALRYMVLPAVSLGLDIRWRDEERARDSRRRPAGARR